MTQLPMNGLTSEQAEALGKRYGRNELTPQKKPSFMRKALHVVAEPMFLLLLVAAVIYFVLGEPRDGTVMLVFVAGIISIDIIQEWKTDKTLNALRDLSAPHVRVIRDGEEKRIASADLVPGDLMLLCEGVKIPADGGRGGYSRKADRLPAAPVRPCRPVGPAAGIRGARYRPLPRSGRARGHDHRR